MDVAVVILQNIEGAIYPSSALRTVITADISWIIFCRVKWQVAAALCDEKWFVFRYVRDDRISVKTLPSPFTFECTVLSHYSADVLLFLNIDHMFHSDKSVMFNMYFAVLRIESSFFSFLCLYVGIGRSYLYSIMMNVTQQLIVHRILVYAGTVK